MIRDLQNQQYRLENKGLLWNLLIRCLLCRLVLFVIDLLGTVCRPLWCLDLSLSTLNSLLSRRTFLPTLGQAASTRGQLYSASFSHVHVWGINAVFERAEDVCFRILPPLHPGRKKFSFLWFLLDKSIQISPLFFKNGNRTGFQKRTGKLLEVGPAGSVQFYAFHLIQTGEDKLARTPYVVDVMW